MSRSRFFVVAAVAAVVFATITPAVAGSCSGSKTPDIVDTAASAGSFNTLVAAVKAAGLVDTLKGDGPFTVFAPTDEAFAALPEGVVADLLKPENKDKLISILTYHVAAGKLTAEEVVNRRNIETLNGQSAAVDIAHGVKIGSASVTKTDIMAANGVIHVIDTVLIPSDDHAAAGTEPGVSVASR